MPTNVLPDNQVSILARVLGKYEEPLPLEMARYLLTLGFSDRDKSHMHELAQRNQEDALSAVEKQELFAYADAGTLLSILKSKARRVLKLRVKNARLRYETNMDAAMIRKVWRRAKPLLRILPNAAGL